MGRLWENGFVKYVQRSFPFNEHAPNIPLTLLWRKVLCYKFKSSTMNEISTSNHTEQRVFFHATKATTERKKFIFHLVSRLSIPTNLRNEFNSFAAFCGSRENWQVVDRKSKLSSIIPDNRNEPPFSRLVVLALRNFTEIKQAWNHDGIHRSFVEQRWLYSQFLPSFHNRTTTTNVKRSVELNLN